MISKAFSITILVLVSIGLYLTTLQYSFVFDDEVLILQNKWIKDIRYLPDIFSSSSWSFSAGEEVNTFRPMQHVIYMLEYYIFGLKPWGYHLTNVLFHALNTVLVFLVASVIIGTSDARYKIQDARYMKQEVMDYSLFTVHSSPFILSPAFLAAILFASHPINTESVAWVSTIVELFMTSLYLLSFYLYATNSSGLSVRFLLSVVLFLFAILLKETAVTILFVIVLYDYFEKGLLSVLKGLRRYTPYILVIIGYMVLRVYALGGFTVKKNVDMGVGQLILNVFPLFFQYIKKLILPIDLKAYYLFFPVQSVTEWSVIGATVFTIMFIFFWYIAGARDRVVFLGLSFIVVPLLPVFYLPAIRTSFIFGERYLYLPSFGFALLVSYALERLYGSLRIKGFDLKLVGRGLIFLSLLIVMVYAFGTMRRHPVWKDDFSLWTDTVKKSPDSALARNNLGNAYSNKGLWDKAVSELREAIRIKPDYAKAHSNLGVVYFDQGRIGEAIKEYQIALQLDPNNANAHINLGVVYFGQGRIGEALMEHKIALQLDPSNANAHNNLGAVYSKQGRIEEAIKEYQIALQLDPNNVSAYNNLGLIYFEQGRIEEAIKEYQIALQIKPDYAKAHNNLGIVYMKKGLVDKAIEEYRSVPKLKPEYLDAYNKLGNAYMTKGLLDEAIEEYRQALTLDSDNPLLHYNLGLAYIEKGLLKDAIEENREVFRLDPNYFEAVYNLARLLEKTGDKKGAIDHYRRFIEIAPPSSKQSVKRVRDHILQLEGR